MPYPATWTNLTNITGDRDAKESMSSPRLQEVCKQALGTVKTWPFLEKGRWLVRKGP